MPDLLTHVFIAYSVGTVLSWRVEWLDARYLTVVLVGAFIPDLIKVELVLADESLSRLLGIPFSWSPLQSIGGVAIAILLGSILVVPAERKRTLLLLTVGAVTHLVADGLLVTPTGRTSAVLWPLSRYTFPSPGLYLSTDPLPTVVAGVIAALVWMVTRRWALIG